MFNVWRGERKWYPPMWVNDFRFIPGAMIITIYIYVNVNVK